MLNESLTPVSWRARPRSFVALMSLYESNYVRLGWLAGELAALAGEYRSRTESECELVLTVLENSRYTTTLNLTYLLPRVLPQALPQALPQDSPAAVGRELPQAFLPRIAGDFERLPDIQVRVYHDAHLAEAQDLGAPERSATAAPRVRAPMRVIPERELGLRWQRNMMLNKWLEYCVERGHRFRPPG